MHLMATLVVAEHLQMEPTQMLVIMTILCFKHCEEIIIKVSNCQLLATPRFLESTIAAQLLHFMSLITSMLKLVIVAVLSLKMLSSIAMHY
jgi:hypothetical protein